MNEIEQLFGQEPTSSDEEHWVSTLNLILTSLMLGILMLFLLLSIGHLVDLPQNDPDSLSTTREIVNIKPEVFYNEQKQPDFQKIALPPPVIQEKNSTTAEPPKNTTHQTIYQALLDEFKNDLPRWSADINPLSLTVSFRDPKIFFTVGDSSLTPAYQNILANFFPRFIRILKQFADFIEAISIEGYTSSEWTNSHSIDSAYLNNMALSHQRTRTVLEYCLQLPTIDLYKDWLRNILTANGLASSRIVKDNDTELPELSRRVEFRIFIK